MRMTQAMRSGILAKIRNDIPFTNYTEQIDKLVKEDAINNLPEGFKKLLNEDKSLLSYLATSYVSDVGEHVFNKHYKMGDGLKAQVKILQELRSTQTENINRVMYKISEALGECTTTQRFIQYFPDFEKYIPQEEIAISNLPGNTIAAELAAIGFPLKKPTP